MNVESRQCQNGVEKDVTSGFCDKEDEEKEPGTDVGFLLQHLPYCFGKIGTWHLSSMVPLLLVNWGRSYRIWGSFNMSKHEALQTFFGTERPHMPQVLLDSNDQSSNSEFASEIKYHVKTMV